MQIISGKYKGLKLDGYSVKGTRPTMARVRESLFATIQGFLEGAEVLDLFAGTGILGIEALSNGAHSCTFVEKNAKMILVLENNLKKINNSYQIIKSDFRKIKGKFDIIFLDPPYDSNYLKIALDLILENEILKENGIIVCETEKEIQYRNFKIIKEKKYGKKEIKILKKMEVENNGEGPDC